MNATAHRPGADLKGRFLRSVNVVLDANAPSRIEHFRPTRKSVLLIRALLGLEPDLASLVVAPYGSGKSISAAFALNAVENRPEARAMLKSIEPLVKELDPDVGALLARRARGGVHGLCIPMVGYQPNLAAGLKEAVLEGMGRMHLGREKRSIDCLPADSFDDVLRILKVLEDKLVRLGYDRYFVVWDEFGRHLEALASQGRGHQLNDVQSLAERIARPGEVCGALGLLLHQSLLQYTSGLPVASRRDWKKIEGRFRVIQFVDDSLELTRLIAQIVEERPGLKPVHPGMAAKQLAREISARCWFADASEAELADVFGRAAPLHPAALFLLPRLSARVAQNERTLFSFLLAADLSREVGAPELYDYFADEMRTDTSAGGTHRRWLETQSALSKVAGDETAERILKTACLMSLGLGGERSAVGRTDLVLAVSGFSRERRRFESAVDQLINRNLLLYRKNADSVSVWHGTDLDLRGRLEAEKARRKAWFDLPRLLESEFPAPIVRPLEHNSKTGVRRYLLGCYLTPSILQQKVGLLAGHNQLAPGVDGQVWYVMTRTAEEHQQAREVLESASLPCTVIVSVSEVLPGLEEAGLEVECLLNLQGDRDLSAMDPLASSELAQLLDDARLNLARMVDRLTQPSPSGPKWWFDGQWRRLHAPKALRRELSALMDRVFHSCPRIACEAAVRHQPTRVMVNARKKVNLGILERYGEQDLGIDGNFPDASMFRSVLLHTGLYRPIEHGRWRFVPPEELEDPGFAEVWGRFEKLLTEPAQRPKALEVFFAGLQSPPVGLRRGVIPILFAAALRAFPSARSLARRGAYVADILPSVIEEVCRNPVDYELVILELKAAETDYLRGVLRLLGRQQPEAGEDLIRQCFDGLQSWQAGLSAGALSTRTVSWEAVQLRRLVARSTDPVDLLFRQLPQQIGKEQSPGEATIEALGRCFEEFGSYRERRLSFIRQALDQALATEPGDEAQIWQKAQAWAQTLPNGFVCALRHPPEKGLIVTLRSQYESEERFLEAVAAQVSQLPVGQWTDSTAGSFAAEFHRLVDHIECAALDHQYGNTQSDSASELEGIAHRRIAREYRRMVRIVGKKNARAMLSRLTGRGGRDAHDP